MKLEMIYSIRAMGCKYDMQIRDITEVEDRKGFNYGGHNRSGRLEGL